MAARVTRKVPLHESIFKLNEKLNMLMAEMKKLRYVVLQGMAVGQTQGQQAPLQQEQEEVELQPIEEAPVEPVLARGPGRRSDWHYWGANWAAKNPDIPRDENFSLKMAEAYRAWKEAHPGQTYLDFRGTDVIDGRKRLTQKKGKKVAPAPPRQVTPLAPLRQATPPSRQPTPPLRQATPPLAPAPLPLRQPTPPLRQPTPPLAPAPLPLRQATPPSRQKTPNAYKQPSPGPLSTPSLLQGRRETPPQEYYEPAEEEEEFVEEQELVPQQEKPVRVPIQEESVEESPEEEQEMSPEEEQEVSPEEEQPLEEEEQAVSPEEEQPLEEEEQALSPEEEASIEAAQQQQEEQPEASPEWPEEEQSDLEIVTVGQQEYFRTSNNGLFTVIRDEEGNPDIGSWAGVLSDDGTQVVETEQPEEP